MLTLVVLPEEKVSCSRVCLLICLLFQSVEDEEIKRHRSCRRSMRYTGTGLGDIRWRKIQEGVLEFQEEFRLNFKEYSTRY